MSFEASSACVVADSLYPAALRIMPNTAPQPRRCSGPFAARNRVIFFAVVAMLMLAAGAPSGFAVSDDHNPIGVSGIFEGVITTGCAYNVLNHNARRQIDDIVVPGAIGKYGLKMTRYYNSRSTAVYSLMGAGWTHGYQWGWGNSVFSYPNGDKQDWTCEASLGISDGSESGNDFRLADGGTLHFDSSNGYFQLRTIKDPYGQTTTLAYNNSGFLSRVTEPGGRYLQFTYGQVAGQQVLSQVDACDGRGSRIDWVVYHYASKPTGGNIVTTAVCLTSVDYGEGQHALYTYEEDNSPENPSPPCPCPLKLLPLVKTCQDVRYKGPMRHICYEYQANGPHGAIIAERYSLNGSTDGPRVSRIDPAAPSPLNTDPNFDTTYTETRGDSPTRTFNYTPLHLHRFPDDSCPTATLGPPQQFLLSYTDFQNHTTQLGYDANWYINSVRDARGYITTYLRGPPPNAYPGPKGIGQILRITHPDNTHIDYTYYDESPNISGHYLQQITDERGNITYHASDANHRISRTDYPDGGYETFAYNVFGQVLTHRLKNGAYERFAYDTRGLLTDKWNAKQDAVPRRQ
jgi:YD repeat-containing protein